MRVAFLGTGDFGAPALRALRAAGVPIVIAISQPDRPAGRGLKLRPSAIRAAAAELGIAHVQTEDVNTLAREIFADAEIGVVAAFGQKLGPALLRALPRGFVNIHASLLPALRGAAPHQWAILSGATTTGVTVFQLNERWDAGAIWAQQATPIDECETADELHDRLASQIAPTLILDVLRRIEAGAPRPPEQDASRATRAPKLARSDCGIDWTQPARVIVRRIHGLWSWPAATCMLVLPDGRSERVQLARACVADETASPSSDFAAGAVCADGAIQTGAGRLRLLEIKPAGGRLMSFEDFARGRALRPPARLAALESP